MKGLCCGCIVVAAVASADLHHRNPPLLTDNSLLHPIPSGCRRCHLLHCIVKCPRPLSFRRSTPQRETGGEEQVNSSAKRRVFQLSDVVKL
eukprot:scaffold10278_cov113-Skeletonema_dohrnii-CCMP3373.AAC.8